MRLIPKTHACETPLLPLPILLGAAVLLAPASLGAPPRPGEALIAPVTVTYLVPSQGIGAQGIEIVAAPTLPGEAYELTVTGQYSYGPDSADCAHVHQDGVWYEHQFTFKLDGQMLDCGPFRDDHAYGPFPFQGDGNPMTFQVRDGLYSDNRGYLTVGVTLIA